MSSQDLEYVLEKFANFTAKPAKFLTGQTDAKGDYKNFVKSLYDLTKTSENKSKKAQSSALPELMVEDFDEEQVWQQIELQNSECWDKLVWEVANCMSLKDALKFPVTFGDEDKEQQDTEEEAENSPSESENEEIEPSKEILEKPKSKPKKSSVVDDEFFKLQDMEKFLIQEEKHGGQLVAAESDEDSIDMFDEIDDDDVSEEGGDTMKYADFFQNYDGDGNNEGGVKTKKDEKRDKKSLFPDEINDSDGDESTEVKKKKNKKDKKVKFADEEINESSEDDEQLEDGEGDEIEHDSEEESFKTKPKIDQPSDASEDESIDSQVDIKATAPKKDEKQSEFEQRQLRLKQTINRLEEKNFSDAPWQLKGEVDASKRPQNSLLQEVLDFDLTTRPPPIITEQTTVTLEDIIRRRIKDKAWDDVIKKEKPVDDALAFRKAEVLDHAKSKLSLAQVYEAEYLKQKGGDDVEEKEPESHTQVREAMSKLFAQLDALSHYHYTPKAAQPEVKIVTNTPAISMEEVAPVAASSASLLAPEEVKKKSGDLISKDERTDTDKKRERRKKKQFQKAKGGISKVTDQRNTKKAAETDKSDKSLKTSKAFFQQLNDDSSSILKNSNKRKNFKNKGN